VRRRWIRRIVDHHGTTSGEGGIEVWLRLGEAVGLTREEVSDGRHLVPGVRFAVDAYVTFTRTRAWVEAVTEHCRSDEEQARAVAALSFKNDVLWSMMDAIDRAYAE
jgi:pyrroloquinoline-quinone synthase